MVNYWLSQFAYRIDVGVLVFVWSGLAALVIAWLTMLYQSLKAALVKPVNSLRYE
jgi:putative ABC transport system permease protein